MSTFAQHQSIGLEQMFDYLMKLLEIHFSAIIFLRKFGLGPSLYILDWLLNLVVHYLQMRYVHFLPGFLQIKNTSVGLLLKFRNSPDFQLEFSHFYFQIRGHIWKEKWVNSHFFYQTNYLSKLKKFTKIRIFNCCYTKCTVDYYFQYFCGLFPESLQNFANGDIFIYIPSYEGNRLPSKIWYCV